MRYNRHQVARFLTHLAATLQEIYGARYQVHPLHCALVADRILRDLTGANYHDDDDDDDDDDNPSRPFFHPRAPKLTLRSSNLFFTQFARFAWCVVLGDHYYSFSQTECLEYGHGKDWIDVNRRSNMLDDHRDGQEVFVYMYQDEDNFETVSMQKGDNNNNNDIIIKGPQSAAPTTSFQSLMHFYVMGKRVPGNQRNEVEDDDIDRFSELDDDEEDNDDEANQSNNNRPPSVPGAEIVDRLHWLRTRKLIDISEEDWTTLCTSINKSPGDYTQETIAVIKPMEGATTSAKSSSQ